MKNADYNINYVILSKRKRNRIILPILLTQGIRATATTM